MAAFQHFKLDGKDPVYLSRIVLVTFLLLVGVAKAEPVVNPFTILLEHAKNGNVDAMFEVGKFYANGDYTDQNWGESIYWYQKAVENNHPRAMLFLGRILLRGVDKLEANVPRAIQLIEQAANSGDAEAQFQLAQLFEKGEAVEQDLPNAIRWYRAASLQKYPAAKSGLKRSIKVFRNRARH